MRLSMPKTLSSKPWLLVALLFGGFVACWIFLITIAVKNAPKTITVPVQNAGH